MSFQAYLDNIQAKTGKSPADFLGLATQKGFAAGGKLKPDGTRRGRGLGHGNAMAIVALLKGKKPDGSAKGAGNT